MPSIIGTTIVVILIIIAGLSPLLLWYLHKVKRVRQLLKEQEAELQRLKEEEQTILIWLKDAENREREKLQEIRKEIFGDQEIDSLREELDKLNQQIEQRREEIRFHQQEKLFELTEDTFHKTHSVSLTDEEKEEINLLRNLVPKFSQHKDVLLKLIWTQYYQKPIQELCKKLQAEKACGIYKITNAENEKVYIGKSVDIADRWKTHCKTGLGINTISHLTNKFYKALYREGIENFSFQIIETLTPDQLDERERYWIEFYNCVEYGYNTKVGG